MTVQRGESKHNSGNPGTPSLLPLFSLPRPKEGLGGIADPRGPFTYDKIEGICRGYGNPLKWADLAGLCGASAAQKPCR